MCGRYTLSVPLSNLIDAFEVPPPDFDLTARFNISPTQDAPVVALGEKGRGMGLLRWGLVPSWAREPSLGSRLINARSETVREKPAFRGAFQRRRCLVPADGWFEWRKEDPQGPRGGTKTPFWIHREGRLLLAFAGLWERWEPRAGAPLFTFAILTAEAAPALRPIHDRMPVILPREAWTRWLDPHTPGEDLVPLLASQGPPDLRAHAVSTLVNSPRNDLPACTDPVQAGPTRATPGALS